MTLETVEAIEVALGRLRLVRPAVRGVLLGVSGGADSLALLSAFAERRFGLGVFAATVDHGLRPEAAGEAAYVAGLCRDLGIAHRTLHWREAALLPGNLMAAAREARYRLLAAEAARVGADALLVAHHADDQVETHLLALARDGTGAALAGMRAWRDLEPGLVLLRPFLDLPKRALAEAARAARLVAVVDPTNADMHFHRVRLRVELANGVHDTAAINRAIGAAASLRDEQDTRTAAMIGQACAEGSLTIDMAGTAFLNRSTDDAALWSRLLTAVGGGLHPPEGQALHRLAARNVAGEGFVATLGGCRMGASADRIVVAREYGRAGPPGVSMEDDGPLVFDRRFTISLPLGTQARRLEPLGRLGLGGAAARTLPVTLDGEGQVCAVHPALRARFANLPILSATQRVGWRIWADLPGEPPERLTAQPQNAANGLKAVGKDLAATYLRGRVKVRTP